jgi:hypothetical protein
MEQMRDRLLANMDDNLKKLKLTSNTSKQKEEPAKNS